MHLKLLARISRLLKNDGLKERLLQAQTAQDVVDVIAEEDEEF